jgi:hypothetical protein
VRKFRVLLGLYAIEVGCTMSTIHYVLYTLQTETSTLELEGPMGFCEGDTCVDLHVRLEAPGVLEWSWIREGCPCIFRSICATG